MWRFMFLSPRNTAKRHNKQTYYEALVNGKSLRLGNSYEFLVTRWYNILCALWDHGRIEMIVWKSVFRRRYLVTICRALAE